MDTAHLEGRLRESGVPLTPQRRAIVRFLAGSTEHPTAQQIFEAVTRDFPITSRSTVYNTLNLLKELGAVTEMPMPGGESRYDPNTGAHHHLRCVDCGRLHDIPAAMVKMRVDPSLSVVSASVTFEGHCPTGC